MEQWRRWREPLAVVLLVVAGIRLLVGIAAVPVLALDDAYGSFATAAGFEANRTFDLVLLLVTAGAAAACLLPPPSPRAKGIVTVALIETALAVLVSFGYGVMGLLSDSSGRGIELIYLLLGLVLPVLAVVALLVMLRVTALTSATQPVAGPPAPAAQLPAPPPALPAAWQPEQATGRVWNTAGDAARGAPGAGWAGDDSGAGWQPIPGPAEPPHPEQR